MGDANQDPSMEEILASIKRVIADDSRAVVASPRAGSRPRLHVEQTPPPEPEPEAQAELPSEEEDVLELSNPVRDDDGLTSADTTVAARQSLAALAAMRAKAPEPQPVPQGDGPLEAVVREMLRPMLKDWLDNRLPELVEEMVAREIARITGKNL
jgi:uncharacterized protein